MIAALLGVAGAMRWALGWREVAHDGQVLDRRLGALFAFFRLTAVRAYAVPTVQEMRRATLRTPALFGTRSQRSVRTRAVQIPGTPTLPARLYLPRGTPLSDATLLVYFHGGGFVVGDLDTHDPTCRTLAAGSGMALLAVAYRLAPEHQFPVAVDDALRAFDWAAANATSLGVAAGQVGVGGDSAGGNLAAVVAQARRGGAVAPCVQMLLYPAVDVAGEMPAKVALGAMLDERLLRWFGAQYIPPGQDATDIRLSPLRAADFSGLCPAIVVTAGFDPLREQGQAYAEALRVAGVPVDAVDYPNLAHGFADFAGVVPAARAALEDVARRLGRIQTIVSPSRPGSTRPSSAAPEIFAVEMDGRVGPGPDGI